MSNGIWLWGPIFWEVGRGARGCELDVTEHSERRGPEPGFGRGGIFRKSRDGVGM